MDFRFLGSLNTRSAYGVFAALGYSPRRQPTTRHWGHQYLVFHLYWTVLCKISLWSHVFGGHPIQPMGEDLEDMGTSEMPLLHAVSCSQTLLDSWPISMARPSSSREMSFVWPGWGVHWPPPRILCVLKTILVSAAAAGWPSYDRYTTKWGFSWLLVGKNEYGGEWTLKTRN
jgi:hypothetical protein